MGLPSPLLCSQQVAACLEVAGLQCSDDCEVECSACHYFVISSSPHWSGHESC